MTDANTLIEHAGTTGALYALWQRWIADFDACAADNQWSRLEPWLADDIHYSVAGAPFACSITGKDAVLSGWEQSLRNFDQKLDARHWTPVGVRVHAPNLVTTPILSRYERAGCPDLSFPAYGQWVFDGDKLTCAMDIYDVSLPQVQAAFEWLAEYGADLDASYE